MHLIYLHGFASSARSSKAAFFRHELAERGVDLLDARLQRARLLDADHHADGDAGIAADRRPCRRAGEPDRIQPRRIRRRAGGAERDPDASTGSCCWRRRSISAAIGCAISAIVAWRVAAHRQAERVPLGYGRVMPVHYSLYRTPPVRRASRDVSRCRSRSSRDAATPPSTRDGAAVGRGRPNVELHMLDDDHQLLASLEFIWGEMVRFLALPARTPREPET